MFNRAVRPSDELLRLCISVLKSSAYPSPARSRRRKIARPPEAVGHARDRRREKRIVRTRAPPSLAAREPESCDRTGRPRFVSRSQTNPDLSPRKWRSCFLRIIELYFPQENNHTSPGQALDDLTPSVAEIPLLAAPLEARAAHRAPLFFSHCARPPTSPNAEASALSRCCLRPRLVSGAQNQRQLEPSNGRIRLAGFQNDLNGCSVFSGRTATPATSTRIAPASTSARIDVAGIPNLPHLRPQPARWHASCPVSPPHHTSDPEIVP